MLDELILGSCRLNGPRTNVGRVRIRYHAVIIARLANCNQKQSWQSEEKNKVNTGLMNPNREPHLACMGITTSCSVIARFSWTMHGCCSEWNMHAARASPPLQTGVQNAEHTRNSRPANQPLAITDDTKTRLPNSISKTYLDWQCAAGRPAVLLTVSTIKSRIPCQPCELAGRDVVWSDARSSSSAKYLFQQITEQH